MRFVSKTTKRDAVEVAGLDWAKIVKVDGGYMFFETVTEYKTWMAQR